MAKKKKPFLPSGMRNMFIIAGILFLGLFILHGLTEYTRSTRSVPYSTFVEWVERGQVKGVNISGQDVQGQLKDDTYFETVAPTNPNEWSLLHQHAVPFGVSNMANQFNFWYLLLVLAIVLSILWAAWFITRQVKGGGGGSNNIFSVGKSRARMFMPSTIKDNFDSVAGADEAKEELQDLVDFLKNPEKYRRLGAKITRGVLLIGAPGNGKTLLARAVAGEANCPFFSVSGSDFIEVFVGVGASRVRDLFAQARKYAPSIIFIDEIDAVGRHRGSGLGGGHDEREQTLNQLLTEMDGFQTSETPVIVIAATNRPDVLDYALLRPGRFDKRVNVPYPDLKSREKILGVHAKNIKIDPEVSLEKLARGTPGFTGADLANLVNEAALIASKTNQNTVTTADFEEARDKILLGKEVRSIIQTPEDLKVTAYHEAGHALVCLMTPEHSDPLHKVSIVPRGRALGVTHSLPEREKYVTNADELHAKVMYALGGRAAEELVFNRATTGSLNDFERATDIIRAMVCRLGMSDLGMVVYSQKQGDFIYSQKVAEQIDHEVKRIMEELYGKTRGTLQTHRDKLDTLANALIEKETLSAGDVYELLDIEPREEHRFTEDQDGEPKS